MTAFASQELAAAGTTGNNTGSGVHVGLDYVGAACVFTISAAGATPTVTFKFQGSFDNSAWFDLGYVTDATDTVATTTRAVTAVGSYVNFLSNPTARRYKYFRVVTTSNTNVTYNAKVYLFV